MCKIIILLALTIVNISSIRLIVYLPGTGQQKCFYQTLMNNEKYSVKTQSYGNQKFTLDVFNQQSDKWKTIISKQLGQGSQQFSKLALTDSTHMFCVANKEDETLKLGIQIQTGLQLANLQHLPDLNDQQNLHNQIDWMQKQKEKLIQAINRQQLYRNASQNISNMMSTLMIIFAILGLISIVAVNYVFYVQAKRILKDRKII